MSAMLRGFARLLRHLADPGHEDRLPAPFSGTAHALDGGRLIFETTWVEVAGLEAPRFPGPWARAAFEALKSATRGEILHVLPLARQAPGVIHARVLRFSDGSDLSEILAGPGRTAA